MSRLSNEPIGDPFLEAYGEDAFAIYVHVPFCDQKCAYCDFFTITDAAGSHPLRNQWLEIAFAELLLWLQAYPQLQSRTVGSVFFGGGTPSLIPPHQILDFLARVRSVLTCSSDMEVAMEVQPRTYRREDFGVLGNGGINRWSIGAQSLSPIVLKSTGRLHTVSDTMQAIEGALSTGKSTGVDLIACMPGESLSEFVGSVGELSAMGVHHLSTYDLTFHEGTEWERASRRGEMVQATEDDRANWQIAIYQRMADLGYHTYEVSNHCQPGTESRHNCAYWEGADYIGLGAGAHGFLRPERYANPPQAKAWTKSILSGQLYALKAASPSHEVLITENLHMALRKTSGVNRSLFRTRFGVDSLEVADGAWGDLKSEGLALWDDRRIWLTKEGRLKVDGITEFLVTRIS